MAGRARDVRWAAAGEVLRLLRTETGITRTQLARRLGLSSGTATDLIARLRDRHLVAEAPAPAAGRGRPTTVVGAHPRGPLLLAVDIRPGGWTTVLAAVDGSATPLAPMPHERDTTAATKALRRTVTTARRRAGVRLRAVSIAVAGTVVGTRVVQAGVLGWPEVDLAPVMAGTGTAAGPAATAGAHAGTGARAGPGSALPLLVGNDATLAAVAEAGHGAARGARTAVHVLVDAGIGGALTIDGRPVTGRSGAAGEFGHLPFGDPGAACACGAYGCWETGLGGPDVPAALGRGIAGLVNAHDPDVVTLGGRAAGLVAASEVRASAGHAAFRDAYRRGLMVFHRDAPPPVVAAAFGDDGALRGAIDTGLDHLTSAQALEAWTATVAESCQ